MSNYKEEKNNLNQVDLMNEKSISLSDIDYDFVEKCFPEIIEQAKMHERDRIRDFRTEFIALFDELNEEYSSGWEITKLETLLKNLNRLMEMIK